MKFSYAIFVVSLVSAFFLVVPVVHLFQNRAPEFARQVGVDSICTMVGLLGLFTVSALVGLNRRLSAVEKSISSQKESD